MSAERKSGVRREVALVAVRYGLAAGLVIAGFVILLTADGDLRWEGWAMCVGAGLSVLLLNWLFRLGSEGDRERDAEAAARDYYSSHGYWPDEAPREKQQS
jgi:hypothetical protein